MLKRDVNNAAFDIVGESLWGFQAGMITSVTVLVMILRQFGAGPAMIGSISSIETCAMLFPQVIGLTLFRSRSRRKVQLMVYHYVVMIPLLFLIAGVLHFAPRLPSNVARICLLTCWGLFVTSIGVVIAVWMDWVAGLFEVRFRGTVMGLSFCGASALGAAGGLLSGWLIGHGHSANTYSSLYFWSAVIATVAMTTFWFIDDPGALEADKPSLSTSHIVGNLRESLGDDNFRAFLIGRIIATSGFCILPLVANYFASRDGGAIGPGTLVTMRRCHRSRNGICQSWPRPAWGQTRTSPWSSDWDWDAGRGAVVTALRTRANRLSGRLFRGRDLQRQRIPFALQHGV